MSKHPRSCRGLPGHGLPLPLLPGAREAPAPAPRPRERWSSLLPGKNWEHQNPPGKGFGDVFANRLFTALQFKGCFLNRLTSKFTTSLDNTSEVCSNFRVPLSAARNTLVMCRGRGTSVTHGSICTTTVVILMRYDQFLIQPRSPLTQKREDPINSN